MIAVADLVLWDGARPAFRENVGTKLSDALKVAASDETWQIYLNDDGELVAEQLGHDNPVNPTVMRFRAVKKGVSEKALYTA